MIISLISILKTTKNTRFIVKLKKIKAKIDKNNMISNDEVINEISFVKKKLSKNNLV